MIALLAAVPEETEVIRKSLQDASQHATGGLALTEGKLAGQEVCLAHSGIGKAAAAAATITLLGHCQAEALCLFGCGGAYPNSGLGIGDLALADGEFFGDEGVATVTGFQDLATMGLAMRHTGKNLYNKWPTDRKLLDWAKSQKPDIQAGLFVTVSTCTGSTTNAIAIEKRTRGICENMEGAAVALACHQLSTPLLEIRGISNLVEDRDTEKWDLAAGMTAAQHLVMDLLKVWPRP